jgi:hypothetical protein
MVRSIISGRIRAEMSCMARYVSTDILIDGDELCRLFRGGRGAMDACCKAMSAELRLGDTVIIEGAAHRGGCGYEYQLPRKRQ